MRRTAEFDAFGPWIDEVHSPEDVPRLFRDRPVDLERAQIVLKVPRRISRRDANPDMDLYDHLVVVDDHGIEVRSREGSAYRRDRVEHERIAVVHSSVDLLDGRFHVLDTSSGASSRRLGFRYNSVSHELVEQLVRVLRSSVPGRPGAPGDHAAPDHPLQLGLHDLGDAEVALVTEQRDITEHERDIVPVAAHGRRTVARRGGALHGVLDVLRPVTLQGAVVCATPAEVHLVHRRTWFTTGRTPVSSVAHTVWLVPHVTRVTEHPSERYEGVEVVTVTSGQAEVEVPFPEGTDSGTAFRRALMAASPH
ncbi:hypothetical protein N866_05400 [Actinotalea ferrariae CF5-4]|uniref:Uncharacterized protein n=1 Tax=Actinotalea ferrariae CF5-4 TaxID=948458 RepID=A0A021VNU3_9CELL|nr:hypothetical protein [Actinotalea ferrariae]EYR62778.1 hypothetical protein N866_05400 [Actinotalea ferrariae CF5-4]